MASEWVRVPSKTKVATNGADEEVPKYMDRDGVTRWSRFKTHPDGAPRLVVRVHGDAATLTGIVAESDVQDLDRGNAAQALVNMGYPDRSADEWEGFLDPS